MTVQPYSKPRARIPALGVAVVMVTALMVPASPASAGSVFAGDYSGSDLWLHYVAVDDADLLGQYRDAVTTIVVDNVDASPVYRHTASLAMEPGATQTLVESTLQAARGSRVSARLPCPTTPMSRSP